MKSLSNKAKQLLSKDSVDITVREEWAFELLRSMVMEPDVFQTISDEIELEAESKLIERAIRMADLLAEKLSEGDDS